MKLTVTFLKKVLFRRVIGHTVLSQSSYSIFLCLYLLKKSIFNPSFLNADIHPYKKEATLTTLELRNAQLLLKYIWYVLGALRNTVAKVCFLFTYFCSQIGMRKPIYLCSFVIIGGAVEFYIEVLNYSMITSSNFISLLV